MTQYMTKPRFTSEQTIHPHKVPQKPNFIVILNALAWIPTQTVLHELEIFHNYRNIFTKNVEKTYQTQNIMRMVDGSNRSI